jgi:hypothetical protein
MPGNGNAPELDAVSVPVRKEVVRIHLVGPTEEVRLWLLRARAEDTETHRHVLRATLSLRPLEIGEPLLERRALCVTLAHRCHTVDAEGPVAQLVEQGTFNPKVTGSIPVRPIANCLEWATNSD